MNIFHVGDLVLGFHFSVPIPFRKLFAPGGRDVDPVNFIRLCCGKEVEDFSRGEGE